MSAKAAKASVACGLAAATVIVLAWAHMIRSPQPSGDGDFHREDPCLEPAPQAEAPETGQPSSAPASEHLGVFVRGPSEGKTYDQMARLCGVNCLYLVNRYYGIECPYRDVRNVVAPTDMGTSLERLRQAAEAFGYVTEMRAVPLTSLCEVDRPAIVLAQPDDNGTSSSSPRLPRKKRSCSTIRPTGSAS